MEEPDSRMSGRDSIALSVRRIGLGEPGDAALTRAVPVEAPVSIEVCGIGYAVMMATPSDLQDYAVGLALSEGLVDGAETVYSLNGPWLSLCVEVGLAL